MDAGFGKIVYSDKIQKLAMLACLGPARQTHQHASARQQDVIFLM